MTLHEILRAKGNKVYTTIASATLAEVIETLVEHKIGSLVVVDEKDRDFVVGIITERDILRACAANHAPLNEAQVSDVMTAEVITGARRDSLPDTMGVMTEHRVRHLPIVENGRLVGMISIGDVVKFQHQELTAENRFLKDYIQGDPTASDSVIF
jgi:CBS domain-containing protein